MNCVYLFVSKATSTKSYEIEPTISHRLTSCNDIRRHLFSNPTSALNHHIATNTAKLMNKHSRANDRKVIYNHLACELSLIANNTSVSDYGVVSHVHTLHQKIIASHHSTTFCCCTSVDCNILSNGVIVTDFRSRLFPAEF